MEPSSPLRQNGNPESDTTFQTAGRTPSPKPANTSRKIPTPNNGNSNGNTTTKHKLFAIEYHNHNGGTPKRPKPNQTHYTLIPQWQGFLQPRGGDFRPGGLEKAESNPQPPKSLYHNLRVQGFSVWQLGLYLHQSNLESVD